jgi:hypothetical protein
VVEEAGAPGENQQPRVNFIICSCESSAPFFVIYKGFSPLLDILKVSFQQF